MSSGGSRSSAAQIIAAECVAVRLRSLNRSLTSLYDDALRRSVCGSASSTSLSP